MQNVWKASLVVAVSIGLIALNNNARNKISKLSASILKFKLKKNNSLIEPEKLNFC